MSGNSKRRKRVKSDKPIRRHATLKEAELQARENQALKLRLQNFPYRTIAEKLGFETGAGAWKAAQRALARERFELAPEVRKLELGRLDDLSRRLWLIHGEKESTKAEVIQATQALLSVMSHRARLLGLNAPVQIELTDAVAEILDVVRAHVPGETFQAICAELDRRGGSEQAGDGEGEGAPPAPGDGSAAEQRPN